MPYTLIRTTPDGWERKQGPVSTLRAATILAAYVLRDNASVLKSDARRVSVQLGNAPLGTTIRHEESGYQFRIEQEN